MNMKHEMSCQNIRKAELELLEEKLTVCKVSGYSPDVLERPLTFTAVTDSEHSLVCPSEYVPADAYDREDGWRCLRVKGQLDFSLTGILSSLLAPLAAARVPVFAISTFDTDYILIKQNDLSRALDAFEKAKITVDHGGKDDV